MKELNAANDDVLSSKDSFKRKNYKWATIQAYYSMFYTARALIYAQKYRKKSHYCLVVALENLYVEKGLIEKGIIENLNLGSEGGLSDNGGRVWEVYQGGWGFKGTKGGLKNFLVLLFT